jgi:hypothetical protein
VSLGKAAMFIHQAPVGGDRRDMYLINIVFFRPFQGLAVTLTSLDARERDITWNESVPIFCLIPGP